MPTLLDFESRSRADLKKCGGRLYWEHPTTETLCCVHFDTDTGALGVWYPGDPCPFDPGAVLAAHNAMGFDRFAVARLGWRTLEQTRAMIDTSELARRAGLPGALDALGTRWLGIPKDKASSAFVKGLSTARRPIAKTATRAPGGAVITADEWRELSKDDKRAAGVLAVITPEVRERFTTYCASDVEIMAHGWPLLESWADLEPDVLALDRVVNDRGIAFDSQLAVRLLECDARLTEAALERAAAELDMSPADVKAIANSSEQFPEFTGAPNAQAETVESIILYGTGGPRAVAMARARQAIASIARGKLEAGLNRVSADGRLRDTLRIYGAHTWRWSHKGMQLGNMPRPAKRFEDWDDAAVCKFADRVLAGKHFADAEEIELLLRACLTASPGNSLAVCDFAGVEARSLAWHADDRAALAVFADPKRSPYKEMAAVIFGCDAADVSKGEPAYTVGKIAELACGYGMGGPKFDWTARKAGSNLEALGVDARAVVYAWRDLHRPIVRFWRDVEQAFAAAVAGSTERVDRFDFVPAEDGSGVAIFMPNGRPIVYNQTHAGRDHKGRLQLSYFGTKSGREHTYGGKITENIIQGMCRDLMADAAVRAEAAGLPVVLHVHDEIVCDVPARAAREGYELLHAIMMDLPEWAEGFPIGAAGHTGVRYRK